MRKKPWFRPFNSRVTDVRQAFDRDTLKRVCEMDEVDFGRAYEMTATVIEQRTEDDFYFFKDNGSDILAVAHLDTVAYEDGRTAHFVQTEAGEVVFSRALDDRLGAYIILHLLPALGITCDILLTVGEESGRSTAEFFDAPKDYNWMIEFDRGGTDVVMYEYEDDEMIDLVEACGARVGVGIFSDICYLNHLEVKGFNWGVGYQDYHSERSHAFLEDTFSMVADFLDFHDANADTFLPHRFADVDVNLWPEALDQDAEYGEWDYDSAAFVSKAVDKLYGDPDTDRLIQA